MTKYKIEPIAIYETTRIPSNCNAITFINPSGTTTVTINGVIPLLPSSSLSIEGNANEIDITEYDVNFGTATSGVIYILKKIFQP